MYIPYTGSTFTVSNYNIYKLLSLYLPGTKLRKYFVYHIISTILIPYWKDTPCRLKLVPIKGTITVSYLTTVFTSPSTKRTVKLSPLFNPSACLTILPSFRVKL